AAPVAHGGLSESHHTQSRRLQPLGQCGRGGRAQRGARQSNPGILRHAVDQSRLPRHRVHGGVLGLRGSRPRALLVVSLPGSHRNVEFLGAYGAALRASESLTAAAVFAAIESRAALVAVSKAGTTALIRFAVARADPTARKFAITSRPSRLPTRQSST